MIDGVNLPTIILAAPIVSLAMRTSASQWMLRVAILWCALVALAWSIQAVDHALPTGWTWKVAEILPAIAFWGLSLLRREPQRLGAYPWARGNGSGSAP